MGPIRHVTLPPVWRESQEQLWPDIPSMWSRRHMPLMCTQMGKHTKFPQTSPQMWMLWNAGRWPPSIWHFNLRSSNTKRLKRRTSQSAPLEFHGQHISTPRLLDTRHQLMTNQHESVTRRIFLSPHTDSPRNRKTGSSTLKLRVLSKDDLTRELVSSGARSH